MLQDLTPSFLRARSFALWSFVVSVFGAAGPLLAGALSDWMFDGHLVNAITFTAIPALILSSFCAIRDFLHTLKEQPQASHPNQRGGSDHAVERPARATLTNRKERERWGKKG